MPRGFPSENVATLGAKPGSIARINFDCKRRRGGIGAIEIAPELFALRVLEGAMRK
jgi:hypothetical protein